MGKFFNGKKGGYPRWKNSNKLVHRTVLQNKLGGKIWKGYDAHHIDGNIRNFRKSNLVAVKHSKHMRYHAKKRRSKWW
jgi:hypothetical protein